jgi:hypothetical protein
MLPNPPCNIQQNIQPLSRLTETAKNRLIPISHAQNLAKLASNLVDGRLFGKLKVEAADFSLKIFEAEKAAVRASIGYVQVKLVIQPVNSRGFFIFSHAIHVCLMKNEIAI